MINTRIRNYLIILLIITLQEVVFTQTLPFQIKADLFDNTQPNTLGLDVLPGTETFIIYHPNENEDKYNHGVVLIPFKGLLYAQWQSSSKDEDAEDTWVAYSKSENGEIWTEPDTLAPKWKDGIKTSGGWWTDGETLVAYICVWPNQSDKPRGGYTEYITSTDGIIWSHAKPLLNNNGEPVNGIIEQDPHALPDGRIISAFHEQPGLVLAPYYTDDARGTNGWTKGKMQNLPYDGTISRELEPSWFYQSDGSIVMLFRDQGSSFRKLASISNDRGESWSTPVLTNVPDSRAKQSAGNLPNGTAYQINNPTGNKTRFPLVIILSEDGKLFDHAYLIRSGGEDLQPQRFQGRYKRAGYSYPKSVIWKNHLYVGYASNKEDVELTRLPLNFLEK